MRLKSTKSHADLSSLNFLPFFGVPFFFKLSVFAFFLLSLMGCQPFKSKLAGFSGEAPLEGPSKPPSQKPVSPEISSLLSVSFEHLDPQEIFLGEVSVFKIKITSISPDPLFDLRLSADFLSGSADEKEFAVSSENCSEKNPLLPKDSCEFSFYYHPKTAGQNEARVGLELLHQGKLVSGSMLLPPFAALNPIVKKIYRSVGPKNTRALLLEKKPNQLKLSAHFAEFKNPLPNEIGRGDVLIYEDEGQLKLAILHHRISPQLFLLKSTSGNALAIEPRGSEGATIEPASLNPKEFSIFRSYTSLNEAENGLENKGIPEPLRNFDTFRSGKNLLDVNEDWSFYLYADAVDTDAVRVVGWTTGPQNRLRFKVADQATEVGRSQRHKGSWQNTGFYLLEVGALGKERAALEIRSAFVDVVGLMIHKKANKEQEESVLYVRNIAGEVRLLHNFLRGAGAANKNDYHSGISVWNGQSGRLLLYNNLIASVQGGVGSAGVSFCRGDEVLAAHNTLLDVDIGFSNDCAPSSRKWLSYNLVQGAGRAFLLDADNLWHENSDYNISSDSLEMPPGPNAKKSIWVNYLGREALDLRLAPSSLADANLVISRQPSFTEKLSSFSLTQWDLATGRRPLGVDSPSLGFNPFAGALY